MDRRLLIFALFLFAGITVLGGLFVYQQMATDFRQRASSDAALFDHTLTIGTDSWAGYFPLCSDEMKARLREQRILWNCEDDNADYAARMKKLKAGELQFAVATVDSFVLNGLAEAYPGAIIAVIDESKGGDAIIATKKIPSLEELKKQQPSIAFTPASPSEFLLKSIADHFDIPYLKGTETNWRVEANGSEEVRRLLESGKVQVGVVWEPDVAKLLAQANFEKLLGTENTKGLIVDVLVARRELIVDAPELVQNVLETYFATLDHYEADAAQRLKELQTYTDLSAEFVRKVAAGVRWISAAENAVGWFGLDRSLPTSADLLVETVENATNILVKRGDIPEDSLPASDPYRLFTSRFIKTFYDKIGAGSFTPAVRDFAPLSEDEWSQLQEVGLLKILPISFQSGTADLSYEGKEQLDAASKQLNHYPDFRVVIKGHTGTSGDAEQNQILSLDRAEAVKRYLKITHSIDPDRLHARGFGGNEPLPQKPGESLRAYGYRLPRVELQLVKERL